MRGRWKPDLGRLLLSLVLAFSLWIVVQNEINPEQEQPFVVPVEITDRPAGLILISGPTPSQVTVRVSGPQTMLRDLQRSSLRALVSLANVGAGAVEVPVRVQVDSPRITVRGVEPPAVAVQLEEQAERTVPVQVNVLGSPPFGYSAGATEVTPRVVRVIGPSSTVERVDRAVVEVKIEGVTVDVNGAYAPTLVDNAGEHLSDNLRLDPPTVFVEIPIMQEVRNKTVGIQAVTTGRPAAGYWIEEITAEPATVTVVGDPQSLSSIDLVQTEPVDISNASGTIVREVKLVQPVGASLVQQTTATVTVRIGAVRIAQVVSVPVAVRNLPAGFMLQGSPPVVSVTLTGPAPALSGVRNTDLVAAIDMNGLQGGTHKVAVEAAAPEPLRVEDVSPREVSVTLVPVPTATPTPTASATLLPTPRPTATATTPPSATATVPATETAPPTSTATPEPTATSPPPPTEAAPAPAEPPPGEPAPTGSHPGAEGSPGASDHPSTNLIEGVRHLVPGV